MDREITIKALRTPYKPLLEIALRYVALSDAEEKCLEYCYMKKFTLSKT